MNEPNPDSNILEDTMEDETIMEDISDSGQILEGTAELDDIPDIEGEQSSSVQIAPTDEANLLVAEEEFDPYLVTELGDRVLIDSQKYGRVIGYVYYRDENLIRVMPDGLTNLLFDYPVVQTDDEEQFEEDLGVESTYVIDKRKFESFTEQQDFRVGQTIETLTSSSNIYKTYTIKSVNPDTDFIEIEDDVQTIEKIEFGFIGIPLDTSFSIIRIRQIPIKVENVNNTEVIESQELREGEERIIQGEEGEEIEEVVPTKKRVAIVGFVTLTKATVYKEATATQLRYPDNLQKVDALNDFLNMLDPILQKDLKAVRAVRILVETLFNLKQATIQYNEDGSIRGQKEISVSTIGELIQKTEVPLGRPVLDVAKKLYIGLSEDDIESSLPITEETDEYFLESFKKELQSIIDNKSNLVSSSMAGAPGGQIVLHWLDTQSFLKKYLSPWVANNTSEPLWQALTDSEFFRYDIPDLENPTVEGYIPTPADLPPILDRVPFSLVRGLSTTFRKGEERRKQALIPAESATMKSYLLFPAKVVSELGITRSGNLAIDSGRSHMIRKSMKDILSELNGVQEIATSDGIVALGIQGNTLGNIPITDYLEGISIPALGLGDTFSTLNQFGLNTLELTPEIIDTLQTKIESYQAQLITAISKLREQLQQEGQQEIQTINLIDDLQILEDGIRSEPILVEDLLTFERTNPTLANLDIAQIAYLLKKHADYFQVSAGNNSLYTAKERIRATRDIYLETLYIANLLKRNKDEAGLPPVPNKCEHVAKLVSIRKIQDDTERFQILTKFFSYYQGTRDENWIKCNICEENLICLHERLQIQAFINQREKETIQKEIILNFSGGQFQGKYICRNCGQPIRDIEFDNNMEFDDNGKPIMGRSVIVDKDAQAQEELNTLLSGAPIEGTKKISISDTDKPIYLIIREVADRIGVNIDQTGYESIIKRVQTWINKLPTRAEYAGILKRAKNLPDYDVMISRNTICSSAGFLLLEIQTRIPSYIVRYTLQGCKNPGFDGYPLDTSSKQGLEYISCAVSSIASNQAPWNQTGFQKERSDVKRQQYIIAFIESILKKVVSDDRIQDEILRKQRDLRETLGIDASKGAPRDMIPKSFLPEQIIVSPSVQAENATIPEVAQYMGIKGKLSIIKQWIRQAHILAKKTASLVRGSPFIETTCCLGNIKSPSTFWNNISDLPDIGKRIMIPNIQGASLQVHFNPRPSANLLVQPEQDLYYRLFLKYCFQGQRIGYPHEAGLTHRCPWCGFQFPSNPNVLDTDTEGKSALSTQQVNTDTNEFIRLLDRIHDVNAVESIKPRVITSMEEIMNDFSNLTPEPIDGWKQVIQDTVQSFLSLPKDANRGDVAQALGVISDATLEYEKIIEARMSPEYVSILSSITNLSWINFFQVIQTYFITSFQRIITQFNTSSLFVPPELKISEDHKKDIDNIIKNDTLVLTLKLEEFLKPNVGFARTKLQYFVEQMSAILSYKNKIRPIIIPGKSATLVYIQRVLLYGPFATLINSNSIPPNTDIVNPSRSIADTSISLLLETIEITLNKYKKERLSFSDIQLKEIIAVRNEKEKMNIIAEMDRMTDDERAVALTQKRLGMGRWAVGGTKAIYAYDPEHYDRERLERERAGIIDFPGLGPDEIRPQDGRSKDEFGYSQYNDAHFEKDGGYDVEQIREDDA